MKPEVAVYSAGAGNSYGHPHAETLAGLAAVGATVYGTDVNGTVVVTTDGSTYKVEAQQGQARSPPVANATPSSLIIAAVPPSGLASPSTPAASVSPSSLTPDILSVTSPVSPGSNATLKAKTLPGASCTIAVYYKTGASNAQGLYPKTADASGNVSWTWMVGTRTTWGDWRIVVTASKDGKSITKETTFKVGK